MDSGILMSQGEIKSCGVEDLAAAAVDAAVAAAVAAAAAAEATAAAGAAAAEKEGMVMQLTGTELSVTYIQRHGLTHPVWVQDPKGLGLVVPTLSDLRDNPKPFRNLIDPGTRLEAVSYTHLTLPTIYSV